MDVLKINDDDDDEMCIEHLQASAHVNVNVNVTDTISRWRTSCS